METKSVVFATVMVTIMALGMFAVLKPASAAVTYGPRVDQLLCKIYPSSTNEFTAFQAGEVDIIDWPLTKTLVPVINGTAGYTLDKFRQFSLFEFDLNNNQTVSSYPGIKIPTSDKNFRIAMAYMVDKPYIANVIVGGYSVITDAPIMPWLPWYDPLMTTYAYNPALACQTLFNYGWRADADPNSGAVVHFPATWPTLAGGPVVAGQDLATVFNKADVGYGAGSGPGIIFLRRSDDPNRSGAGQLLINGDATHLGLRSIGIAVDDFNVPRATTSPNVMYAKNFMVYTGGWILSRNPDYVCDLFYPGNYDPNPNHFAQNYDHVNDPSLNAAETQIKLAPTLAVAQTASHTFCDLWGTLQPMICLWATAGYYAHLSGAYGRNIHVLNVDSWSIPDSADMLCMNLPGVGITGGTVDFGFASDVQELNVINSQWIWDWQVMDNIYDTLTSSNPLNIGVDMPWMASGWTVGTWNVPNTGDIGTTVTFTLNSGINFINPVTGTVYGIVTPADIAFSLQYVYGTAGWNSPSLGDCFTNSTTVGWAANSGYQIPFIKTTSNTVTVYYQHQSAWAVDWAGGIPIIPKAIFNTINDPTGFYPGGASNVAAMTGSGPFYFSSYSTGVSLLLLANRNYFKPIVPNIDTDPTHVHMDWGIFKSNSVSPWAVNVLDLIGVATSLGVNGPYGGWIPADVNKDAKVNVLDLITVATNLGATW